MKNKPDIDDVVNGFPTKPKSFPMKTLLNFKRTGITS